MPAWASAAAPRHSHPPPHLSYSLFPIPYSLFPIPYSLFPIPYSSRPSALGPCLSPLRRRRPLLVRHPHSLRLLPLLGPAASLLHGPLPRHRLKSRPARVPLPSRSLLARPTRRLPRSIHQCSMRPCSRSSRHEPSDARSSGANCLSIRLRAHPASSPSNPARKFSTPATRNSKLATRNSQLASRPSALGPSLSPLALSLALPPPPQLSSVERTAPR
ncbi:hypothetical protein DYQ86_06435 [Acidobacteria bacterium AB60]|nr:hypothetical protein DYQ86_06435 [Acidobacteria bacterium AB60]